MSKVRLLLVGMLLIFMIGGSAPVGAAVWSGDILGLKTSTVLSFGDGSNNLNAQWFYPGSGIGTIPGYANTNTLFPGTSDAWVFNLGSSIDINTLDTEIEVANSVQGAWADLHTNFVAGQWVAFKGLNDYYGVWYIKSYTGPDSWGRPGTLNGTWHFQDDGSSYFGSTVPVPGAIWLLGSGLIGLVGLKKKFKKQ